MKLEKIKMQDLAKWHLRLEIGVHHVITRKRR